MCRQKNRYSDEITARAVGSHYVQTGRVQALWVYRCPVCQGFHLTRTNHGKRRNVLFGIVSQDEDEAIK